MPADFWGVGFLLFIGTITFWGGVGSTFALVKLSLVSAPPLKGDLLYWWD